MRCLKISDAEVCSEVHAYFNEDIHSAVSKYSIDFVWGWDYSNKLIFECDE